MIELQDISSVSSLADWVELQVMYTSAPLSRAKAITLIAAEAIEDDVEELAEDGDHAEAEDDESGVDRYNLLFDSVLQELERRLRMYGVDPPFKIRGNIVQPLRSWVDAPELFMCLWFSYWGAYNQHGGTKLFERISAEALRSYLSGQAITLGFPAALSFKEQLDELAKALCEERNQDPNPSDKDRGVDVVGWKSFSDQRNGQIILLMQCAAGKHWDKKKPVPMASWTRFIAMREASAIQCISIAEIIPINKWQNAIDDFGIVFDRGRIYQNIYRPGHQIERGLRDEIRDWCLEQTTS